MESAIKQDKRPMMAKFTAIEATRIVADNGTKCMNFEAGETLAVHRDLFTAAMAAGLVPEESLEFKPVPQPANKSQKDRVADGLLEACMTLIARGNPADFTLTGQPRAASVKKLVDFDFTNNDVRLAFEQAIHEVEQDGDDSTEHSESSSLATE